MSFAGGYRSNDSFGMLSQKQLIDELKLTAEQTQKIKDARAAMQKSLSEQWKEMRANQKDGQRYDFRKWQQLQAKQRTKATDAVAKILTKQQQTQLEELQYQMQLRNMGSRAIQYGGSGAAPKLTDEQKKKLQQKQLDVSRELQKMMQQLRSEMEQEALEAVLPKEQLLLLETIQGKKFDIKKPDIRRFNLGGAGGTKPATGIKRVISDIKKEVNNEDDEAKSNK